ncbi:MAG: cytochrome P450 [Pseudomonadota bacterium]
MNSRTEDFPERRAAGAPSGAAGLAHIPGESGLPWFGNAREFLTDARALARRMRTTYGPVSRGRFLGQDFVALGGADALQFVLADRDKLFSSELGWQHSIGRLFTRGLMLLDFDEHRYHRRIMQAAFKREALEFYLGSMNQVVADTLPGWAAKSDFRFYPAVKQLTLDNAAVAFLGVELGADADRLNKAFIDTVAASLSVVRVPIPGLALWRGLKGRQLLSDFFRRQIPLRRASDKADMFTRLCHARSDEGAEFSDQEIVDHMIFLMMAAHDTLTSSLTTAVRALAEHPDWQQRLRDDSRALGADGLAYDDLDGLQRHDWVFNEALRLWGPVPYIPRRAIREFEYGGYRIPANTQISISPDVVHHDAKYWNAPERFDPERFGPDRQEHKSHPFAFAPYGGGAHKCIGMHFAQILAKVFLHRLLLTYRIEMPADYAPRTRQLPMPKPVDGLRLSLQRL